MNQGVCLYRNKALITLVSCEIWRDIIYFTRLRLMKYLAISHADSCNKSYLLYTYPESCNLIGPLPLNNFSYSFSRLHICILKALRSRILGLSVYNQGLIYSFGEEGMQLLVSTLIYSFGEEACSTVETSGSHARMPILL